MSVWSSATNPDGYCPLMRTRSGIIGVVILSLLAACASSGDADELSDEEQEFVDAWAVALQDDDEGLPVEPADAECMATALMAEIGTEPFDDAGVTPDDIAPEDTVGEIVGGGVISTEQADTILDGWDECVDMAATMGGSAADEFELDEDGATCIADGLEEDDLLRDLLRPVFTEDSDDPDEATLTALLELVEACGGPSLVDSIATELASGGLLTDEQARCVAETLFDDLGYAGLANPDAEDEVTAALGSAAEACGVDPSAFAG